LKRKKHIISNIIKRRSILPKEGAYYFQYYQKKEIVEKGSKIEQQLDVPLMCFRMLSEVQTLNGDRSNTTIYGPFFLQNTTIYGQEIQNRWIHGPRDLMTWVNGKQFPWCVIKCRIHACTRCVAAVFDSGMGLDSTP
jgi:hypothetical protein